LACPTRIISRSVPVQGTWPAWCCSHGVPGTVRQPLRLGWRAAGRASGGPPRPHSVRLWSRGRGGCGRS
jgi:hypothetical protein